MLKNKKSKIFIDLDGTILDVSQRIYFVYFNILKKYKKRFLSKNEYLKLKKEKISLKKILEKTGAGSISTNFKRAWNISIENPLYLKLDKLRHEVRKTLFSLKREYQIILITSRHNKKELYKQLRNKKIFRIFNKILIDYNNLNLPAFERRYLAIKKYGKFDKDSIIIGDTEKDILAGKKLKIKTITVFNGMRSKKFLKKYGSDFLIEDITLIKNILKDVKSK